MRLDGKPQWKFPEFRWHWPCLLHLYITNYTVVGDVKEPISLFERVGDVVPGVLVWPVSLVFTGWMTG